MNKVEIVLAIATVGIVLYIGCMIYYEQTDQIDSWLDEHPGEIPDIGAPPRLEFLVVIVLVAAIFYLIHLRIKKKVN